MSQNFVKNNFLKILLKYLTDITLYTKFCGIIKSKLAKFLQNPVSVKPRQIPGVLVGPLYTGGPSSHGGGGGGVVQHAWPITPAWLKMADLLVEPAALLANPAAGIYSISMDDSPLTPR